MIGAKTIPENWVIKKCDDIADITSSKRIHKSDYQNSGIPFFRGKEITKLSKNQKFSDDVVYISEEKFHQLKEKFGAPQEGDILITSVGTIGSIYCVKKSDKFYFKDGNLMWLRKINNELNSNYLTYFMKSNYFQNLINKALGGSSQKALTIVKFKKLNVNIPPLTEQQKIANILSTVDEKIAVIDQQITATDELKKGLMQRLLTKGIGHTEFKDSPLGKIPKSWEVKKIGEILKLGSGKDYKHLEKGEIPVYGTGGYMLSVNEYLYDGESVGIGRKGTIDKPVFLKGKFWTVDTLFYTHSFKNVLPYFVFILFQSIDWYNHNEATGVPSLSKVNIEAIKIALPKLDEQKKIIEIIEAISAKRSILLSKKLEYQQLKKGLMQQLLTGKIRVNNLVEA